jgi:hypothetical protein
VINLSLALIEHDWIDKVNALSTIVIALFTVAMFFAIRYQLRVSKDIERAWVMVKVEKIPSGTFYLPKNTSLQAGKESVSTSAPLQLRLKNEGNGPVWLKSLQARLVFVDSLDQLPKHIELGKNDDQKLDAAPFVNEFSMTLELTAKGTLEAGEEARRAGILLREAVVYGRITYLDKFQEERVSTFGYTLHSAGQGIKRLQFHPEYNRNT